MGPGACDGRYIYLFSERAAVRPPHAKAFFIIHRVATDKDLLWNVMNRAKRKGGKNILRISLHSFPGCLIYSFADFCVKKETVAIADHNGKQNLTVTGRRKGVKNKK